jgi:uncharacterized protein (TIGR03905 family)
MFNYLTKGTCSTKIQFWLQDNKVHSVTFEGGCNGNLKALGVLVEDMDADILIKKLKGLQCGRKRTSCADQLATAVAQAIEKSR